MCGRFTLTPENVEFVAQQLGISPSEVFEEHYVPRWNIAPMQEHWVVTSEREELAPQRATWGLVNWWEDTRREGAKYINARAESIESRRPFREAFQQGRCLIPADGFFEWTGEKNARRPFWFHRPDDGVFAFAGLYTSARLKGEEAATTTFTIVTTEANGLVGRIHDRMPVVLPDEQATAAWLYAGQDRATLRGLLRPVADGYLVARPVSTRANSVQNDDPACLEEAEGEMQGTLL
ncbi:MAG: SOS response-associated peptidase [Dehalococcoidia bacterium]|nr:SOS response-associated peptidase [Dehalococcoidia bacterium]